MNSFDPHQITYDSIYIYQPYAGYLAGWPSPEKCVEQARAKVKELYGDGVPVIVLAPEEKIHDDKQPPLIPRWCYVAVLHGPRLEEDHLESVLFAVWFADDIDLSTLHAIVSKLEWEKNARRITAEDW